MIKLRGLYVLCSALALWLSLPGGLVSGRAIAAEDGRVPVMASWGRLDSILAAHPLAEDDVLKVIPLGEGVHSSVVVIQLAPGGAVSGHIHRDHDEFIHVTRGSCVMRVGKERIEMTAGSLVLVPSGVAHGARAHSEGCVVVSTYSPIWDPGDRHPDATGDP